MAYRENRDGHRRGRLRLSRGRCQIVVLISGSGSNLQSFIDHTADGRLDADIAATLEAHTLGGSITTAFPVTVETPGVVKPNQLHGTINGGGAVLRLSSAGGSIRLTKAEEYNRAEVSGVNP